ncbi:DNA cytosine methyltransferase [Leucobacter luti]|uniref:DNA cytosine methyltransferase n=1 Tax=Leucobacter luti TaxID=340320 RepID=UPI003D014116
MTTLRLIDLFAGAGGMTQGFTETGLYSVAQAVEWDRAAAATYAANHGADHVHVGDITKWREAADIPEVDVVIGGPPCQGFSALGKQDVQDARNRLWREYALTIRASQPKYFVLENVTQFLTSPQFRSLRRWTHRGGPLSDYAVHPFILNAADFGAFQCRRRAVVIGRRRDLPRVAMPEGDWTDQHRTVRQALEGIESSVSQIELPSRKQRFAGAELAGVYTSEDLHVTRRYEKISTDRFAEIPLGGNRFDLPDHLKARCWIEHTTGAADVMGRLRWDRPSVTIRTEFFKPEKGRYLHPVEDRAITHFEAAVLQGFPRSYRWMGSKVQIAKQIGNAVPVQLSTALARHIAALPR